MLLRVEKDVDKSFALRVVSLLNVTLHDKRGAQREGEATLCAAKSYHLSETKSRAGSATPTEMLPAEFYFRKQIAGAE
jgi:hypothetical protein